MLQSDRKRVYHELVYTISGFAFGRTFYDSMFSGIETAGRR